MKDYRLFTVTNEQTGAQWKQKISKNTPPWRWVVQTLDKKYTYLLTEIK